MHESGSGHPLSVVVVLDSYLDAKRCLSFIIARRDLFSSNAANICCVFTSDTPVHHTCATHMCGTNRAKARGKLTMHRYGELDALEGLVQTVAATVPSGGAQASDVSWLQAYQLRTTNTCDKYGLKIRGKLST
jgi:hypothetical protein